MVSSWIRESYDLKHYLRHAPAELLFFYFKMPLKGSMQRLSHQERLQKSPHTYNNNNDKDNDNDNHDSNNSNNNNKKTKCCNFCLNPTGASD